jgi:hypothetical protein
LDQSIQEETDAAIQSIFEDIQLQIKGPKIILFGGDDIDLVDEDLETLDLNDEIGS